MLAFDLKAYTLLFIYVGMALTHSLVLTYHNSWILQLKLFTQCYHNAGDRTYLLSIIIIYMYMYITFWDRRLWYFATPLVSDWFTYLVDCWPPVSVYTPVNMHLVAEYERRIEEAGRDRIGKKGRMCFCMCLCIYSYWRSLSSGTGVVLSFPWGLTLLAVVHCTSVREGKSSETCEHYSSGSQSFLLSLVSLSHQLYPLPGQLWICQLIRPVRRLLKK